MSRKNKQDSLVRGTVILAAAMFTTKVLGSIYRIVISRTIGDFGFGIFDKVYPIYTMLLIIGITGIPVAISKLVAEKRVENKPQVADYIFKVALKVSFFLGLLGTGLLIVSARLIANYAVDAPETYYSILAVAPAIFVVFVMASYRGYFQGHRRMAPTAISQLVEQTIKVIATVGMIYLLLPYGDQFGAAGAISGTFFGAVGGLIVILVIYYRFQRNKTYDRVSNEVDLPSFRQTVRRIFALALPVTFGSLVLPLMRSVDAGLITRRLEVAGYTYQQATSIFGQFGYALTLFRFPTVVAASLAMNLVPNISEADTLENNQVLKKRIAKAFRLVLYATIPASVGLFILARPLCRLIFTNEQAGVPLRFLALGVIAVGIQQITTSILQGFNRPQLPARNLLIGVLLNAGLNYYLTAIPELGIRGAALGTISGFTLAAGLNLVSLGKIIKPQFDYLSLVGKPLFSGVGMGGLVYFAYHQTQRLFKWNLGSTLGAVLTGIISYTLILLLVGGIKKEDVEPIPKIGNKLAAILDNLGLVRG